MGAMGIGIMRILTNLITKLGVLGIRTKKYMSLTKWQRNRRMEINLSLIG